MKEHTSFRIPNAKKWTEQRVREELEAIRHHSCQADVCHLYVALVKQGLYKQLWAYWKKIFHENEDIIEIMLCIESRFEARVLEDLFRKKLPHNVASFMLKNNHGWSDKPEPQETMRTDLPFCIRMAEDEIVIGDPEIGGTYKRISNY